MAAPFPAAATALAWRWVIEALADYKHVDAFTLAELVDQNVDVLKDPSVNERISLRFLEELLDSDSADAAPMCVDHPTTEGHTETIDVESRSEDVLCGYIRKVDGRSNLGDAICKDQLRHFIHQKRAALPKTSLELLEGSIDKTFLETSSNSMQNLDLNKEMQVDKFCVDDMFKDAEILLEFANCREKVATVQACSDPQLKNELPGCQHHFSNVDDISECRASPPNKNKNIIPQNGSDTNVHISTDEPSTSDQKGNEKALQGENEIHDSTSVSDTLKEILASEKCKLVNSQNPIHNDSSVGHGTLQQLCIKCDEPGQLLLCNAKDCPIAVHEGCLEFSVTFDNAGNYFCPFCSYIEAANSYYNARKKISKCRKDLSSFMGWDPLHQKSVKQPGNSKEPNNPMTDANDIDHSKNAGKAKTKVSVCCDADNASIPVVNDMENVMQQEVPRYWEQKETDSKLITNKKTNSRKVIKCVIESDGSLSKKESEQHQLKRPTSVMKKSSLLCHEGGASAHIPKHIEELKDQLQSNGKERCNNDLPCEKTVCSMTENDVKSVEVNLQHSDKDDCLLSAQEKHCSAKKSRKTPKSRKRY